MEHWWNDTGGGKQKYWEKNLSQCYVYTTHLTRTELGSNPGLHGERPPNAPYLMYIQVVPRVQAVGVGYKSHLVHAN
jgi:hypothetical protein